MSSQKFPVNPVFKIFVAILSNFLFFIGGFQMANAQTYGLLASNDYKSLNKKQPTGSFQLLPDTTAAKDSLSNFDSFNKKMEKLFIYIPVPLYSYSTEAGNTFGLAKFNVINLYKNDTVTKPSKISEVFTISTEGRINASISNELVFRNNKYILLSYINYKKTPEYIFGIGNDVKREDVEEIKTERIKFYAVGLMLLGKDFYAGAGIDVGNYFSVQTDSNSFLISENVPGLHGGADIGMGLAAAWDTRDNRYNSYKGHYILTSLFFYPEFFGSAYQFTAFNFDARKFINPWLNHVIAFQATTTYTNHDVPFYDLALMGGEDKMRGYYKGAYRDKVLVDAQVEYRMPVWNIFGVTGWIGTGRVAHSYDDLSFDGFRLSYGGGLRIKVDSAHNTNLRFDFGFGPNGIHGFYINFAEAF